MREEERQEKEYITVERGLPGFQPRRDYRAKLKSRNGDVCEPAVPRRLARSRFLPSLSPWLLVCRRPAPRILMKEPAYLRVSRTASVGTQGGCFEEADAFPTGIKRFRLVVQPWIL